MNVPAKALIGLGVAGAVGGTGYAISTQFATENISKKLTEEGYQILNESDSEWSAILTNYEKSKELKFKDFEGKTGEVEKLKQECRKALEKPVTDKDSYEKAKHWCTVPRDLKTLLKQSGYKALSLNIDSDKEDDELWNSKLDKLAEKNADLKSKKFKGDTNIKTEGAAIKGKENRKAIKTKCKELQSKKHYEVDFKDNLEKAQLWCSIKEGSSNVV